MGQTAQSLTCSITEKPHTGLDECPGILLSCFSARNSASELITDVKMDWGGNGSAAIPAPTIQQLRSTSAPSLHNSWGGQGVFQLGRFVLWSAYFFLRGCVKIAPVARGSLLRGIYALLSSLKKQTFHGQINVHWIMKEMRWNITIDMPSRRNSLD